MNLGAIVSNQKRAVLLVIALLSIGGLIALVRIPRALFPQTDFHRRAERRRARAADARLRHPAD